MANKSLMMVTFNRLDLTKQAVDNIFSVTKDFNFIIVDNGSTDGTIEYLKELEKNHENVRVHYYPQNMGIAIGRNKALKMAVELNTEYFITIDNDVLLPEKWLEDCIDVLDVAEYGITGVNFEKQNFPLLEVNGITVQHKKEGNIGTACKAFKKKLVGRIGYFTTEYSTYSNEDADYSFRARVAGFKIAYIKNRGVHLGEGENDTGEYRKFKDQKFKETTQKFFDNCRKYARGEKSIFIPFSEKPCS